MNKKINSRRELKKQSSKNQFFYSQILLLFSFSVLIVLGCSREITANLNGIRLARLTGQAIDVLSFEDTDHWNGINSTNTNSTQGNYSGEVVVNGWTQVSSIPMSTITSSGETIGSQAFIDVNISK